MTFPLKYAIVEERHPPKGRPRRPEAWYGAPGYHTEGVEIHRVLLETGEFAEDTFTITVRAK